MLYTQNENVYNHISMGIRLPEFIWSRHLVVNFIYLITRGGSLVGWPVAYLVRDSSSSPRTSLSCRGMAYYFSLVLRQCCSDGIFSRAIAMVQSDISQWIGSPYGHAQGGCYADCPLSLFF